MNTFDKELLEEKHKEICLWNLIRYIQWWIMGLLIGLIITLALMVGEIASWGMINLEDPAAINKILLNLSSSSLLISCVAIAIAILIGIAQIIQAKDIDLVQIKLLLVRLNKLAEGHILNSTNKEWDRIWKTRRSKKTSAITCLVLIIGFLTGISPIAKTGRGRHMDLLPISQSTIYIIIALIIGIIIGIAICDLSKKKQQKKCCK